jgi:fluoride exporter
VHQLTQAGHVALGSALGGLLRWGVGLAFFSWFGGSFPWGTFFINITGCLFLGWFSRIMSERVLNNIWLSQDHLRLLVAIGFTGGYTTFSSFEYEANGLLRDGFRFKCLMYVAGSVILGLLAVQLGDYLARRK